MVQRHFEVIDKYVFNRQYNGIHIPEQWQAWETAHFFRVAAVAAHPEAGARLISYGCNNGDKGMLNCTETCGNTTLMYSSAENLWNCMTLGTVAMLVVPGSDTIDQKNLEEMDKRFHFGSLENFNDLNIFRRSRECAWASCSDSKYGSCTTNLDPFKCGAVSPKNILGYGSVMRGPYCEAASAGIDSDIAGQGVVASYVIQYALVLVLAICFKVTKTWIFDAGRIISFLPGRHGVRERSLKWQDTLSETQFAASVGSIIVDLQEAQALFAATISSATIITFSGEARIGMANMLTLFSWIFNHNILRGLITSGMYPVLMVQLVMHRAGNRWWYTLLFVILNWVFMLFITQWQEFDSTTFEDHLHRVSGLPACGGNPGPMSYCQGLRNRDSYGFFAWTIATRSAVHVISSFLIIDWLVHTLKPYFLKRTRYQEIGDHRAARISRVSSFFSMELVLRIASCIWVIVELLTLVMMAISFKELCDLLGMHLAGAGLASWSFGQLVAMAIWIPVVFKFISLNIVGVKHGVEKELDKKHELQSVQQRADDDLEEQQALHPMPSTALLHHKRTNTTGS